MDTQGNTSIGDVAGRDIHKISENVFLFVERFVQYQQQGAGSRIPPGKFATVGIPALSAVQPIHEATLNQLDKLVVERKPSQVIHLHGLPGTGKSMLVARLAEKISPDRFNRGILWFDLARATPRDLMVRTLYLLDGTSAGNELQARPDVPLREFFWGRLTESDGRWLIVVDHLFRPQDLLEILPAAPKDAGACRVLSIGQSGILHLPDPWSVKPVLLSRVELHEALEIYRQALGHERANGFEPILKEIVEALDGHLQLIVTSARLLQSGATSPQRYLERLRQHEEQRALHANHLADTLERLVQELSASQQHLFDCIGVLGEGDWSVELLAAVAMRRPGDMLDDLAALVAANVIERRPDPTARSASTETDQERARPGPTDWYRAGGLAREVALRRLKGRGDYHLRAAQTLMARYLLDRAEELAADLRSRPAVAGRPEHKLAPGSEAFISGFRAEMAAEMPHLRQALRWAVEHEDWPLVRRFAALPYTALIQRLTTNSFELTLDLSMGTISEPTVWPLEPDDPPYLSIPALVPSQLWTVHPGARPVSDDDRNARRPATFVSEKAGQPRAECDLNWHLTACHLVDGVFRRTTFTNARWTGVRAPELILIDVDMGSCQMPACDFSNNTWVGVKARNASLRESSLRRALLRDVHLNGASLERVDFSYAVLERVRLTGANLRGANFTGAILKETSLRHADLRDASFQGAEFNGVDWSEALVAPEQLAQLWDAEGCTPELPRRDASGNERGGARDRDAMTAPRVDEGFLKDLIPKAGPGNDPSIEKRDLRGIHIAQLQSFGLRAAGADLRAAALLGPAIRLDSSDFTGAHLNGATLRAARLPKCNFTRANLRAADLQSANLEGAILDHAIVRSARCDGAILTQARLVAADFTGAGLHGSRLERADLQRANLAETDLREADLRGANLAGASLAGADLRQADLSGAVLDEADLRGADLRGATIEEEQLCRATNTGKARLPRDREVYFNNQNYSERLPDLPAFLRFSQWSGIYTGVSFPSKLDLQGAVLDGNFSRVHLDELNLSFARLKGIFSHCTMRNTCLRDARITGILSNVDLQGSDLTGAWLSDASLVVCDLRGAQVTEEQLRQAARLRGAYLPDGELYDGRYDLPGDMQDAISAGLDPEDKAAMREFCQSRERVKAKLFR
ncbi:MAG: pentapeptide repeat-containing protein [Oscillochloridaceae bacterium]|nr:pentapeptide repeat-containing protein [Chloroflexaceae bacterium]MDW8392026.1 pentapeptide repeat-containing protein [Oscillochloridaceae bacterium]